MQDTVDVSVRRSPKYSVFILTGVFLGMVVGGILALLPVDLTGLEQKFTQTSVMWMLMVMFGIVFGFLGAGLAVIIDKRSVKKARTYSVAAEYEAVETPTAPSDPSAEAPADVAADDESAPAGADAVEDDAVEDTTGSVDPVDPTAPDTDRTTPGAASAEEPGRD